MPFNQELALVWELSKSRLLADAKRNFLSYLWWVLEPLGTLLVFYLVFGMLLANQREGFVYFLLVGVFFWSWFQRSTLNASMSIASGRGLIFQVSFSKWLLPASSLLQDSLKQAAVTAVLLAFLLWSGFFSPYWLLLPLLLFVQLLLVGSIGLLVAAVVPFLPDLRFLVASLVQLLMFASGVFYSPDAIPDSLQTYFFLNPMAILLDAYREILLYETPPHAGRLLGVACAGASLLAVGFWLTHRLDSRYARALAE